MKILRNKYAQRILCLLLFIYIKFTYLTCRWKISGSQELLNKLKNKEPVILAFWHGRLAMMPNFAPYPQELSVMVSRHNDGELITSFISFFRINTIRGSTNRNSRSLGGKKNRGGYSALRNAIRTIKDGHSVCITPDGPKGPRMRVSGTIIELASKTGATIYPISFSASWARIFSSWDRLLLPLPFSKAFFISGRAISVKNTTSKESLEKSRKELENQLNTITREADELAGQVPTEPA